MTIRGVSILLVAGIYMSFITACAPHSEALPPEQSTTKLPDAAAQAGETALPAPTASTVPVASEVSAQAPSVNEQANAFDDWLKAKADQDDFTGSVLLVRHGEVILSEGYGFADREKKVENTPLTRFRIGSITKTFTATAIMQLQEQGLLDVDGLVCDYMPDCPAAWGEITLKQLLNHSSGIVSYTDLPEYWEQLDQAQTPTQLIARFRDLPLQFEPGSKWEYSNSGYAVLGHLIEVLSGQPYDAYIAEHIFAPLSMKDSGYDHDDPSLAVGYTEHLSAPAEYIEMSTPFAAGGLYSTVEDLYKWDRAQYSPTVVSAASIEEMTSPSIVSWPPDNESYGLGWIMWDKGEGRWQIGHDGMINGFSSLILRYPDTDSTIILLSNKEGADFSPVVAKIIDLFGEFYE